MNSPAASTARLLLHGVARCMLGDGRELRLEAKDALLLAYVALQGPTPRGTLATLLWPEADGERARGALRQRLARLKKAAGVDLLTAGETAALAAGVVHEAGEGDLLASIDLDTETELGAWLAAQRARGRQSRAQWLAAAAAQAETEGELATALSHAQALVDLDPTSEHAHRRVMRLHYLRGDIGAALAAYDQCAQMLQRVLGVRPSAETQRLREQVQAGAAPAARHVAGRPAGPLPVTLLRPPRMIGREGELAAFEQAWAARQSVLVLGEAGIGKTRLLEEFAAQRADVLVVRARPGDSNEPLGTLARMVSALAARHAELSEAPAYGQLVAVLPGFAGRAPASSTGRGVQANAVLIDLLAVACRAGLGGLLLDDLQFADGASVDLLLDAREASALGELRWGFGTRPPTDAGVADIVSRVRERTAARVLLLPQLDAAALAALLESLRIDIDDAEVAAQVLLRRVGGSPLYVLEALRQAHASGRRQFDATAHVSELTERRLHAVSEPALALARVAAVAREAFSPALAEAVSGLNALALASPWKELETAQLMAGNRFTHDLVYEAALRSIPESIVRHLHWKVADFIEGAGGEPARIAQHWLAAGEDARAVPHLVAAARRAWRAGRARELAQLFMDAAAIERKLGRASAAFDLLFECADALSETGSAESYELALERARPLATTPGEQARLGLLEAVGRHIAGDLPGFARINGEALLMAIACGERRIEAECRFNKGWLAVQEDRLHEGIEHVAAAVTLCRQAGLADRAAAMDSSLATALSIAGQPRRALETRRGNVAHLAMSGHYGALVAARAADAGDALELGRFDAALDAVEEVLALCDRVDVDEHSRALVARRALACYRRLGRFTQALAAFERATRAIAPKSPALTALGDERARLYLDLGRPDLAERTLAAAEALPALSPRARRQLRLARAHWLAALARDPRPVLAEAVPERIEALTLAWEWTLALGRAEANMDALAQCRSVSARCRAGDAQGLHDPLLALEALACATVADATEAHAAVDAALAVLTPARLGALLPQCALWLQRACQALVREADAQRCVRMAVHWLRQTVESDVPPEFRDSFLHRHPVHRELLTLATRALPPPDATRLVR